MVENITNIQSDIIGIYRSDYNKSYHIREMARQLNKHHVTLLPHLKSLEQAHIVIAEIRGKNKTYILNKHNNLTKQYILLSEIALSIAYQQEVYIIKKINEQIYSNNSPVLFGT